MKRKTTWYRRALSAVLTLALMASVAVVPASAAAKEEVEFLQWTELENYEKSWLGNNFVGTGENGFGEWVQNYIDNAEFVDGTVITASLWDEAGRCSGLYRDGKVNNVTLKTNPHLAAWGFGTANKAVAADENNIWMFTNEHDLLRFTWDYKNINSHSYVGHTAGPGNVAISMTDLNKTLYVLREGGVVETWDGIALQKSGENFTVFGATQITANPNTGELWMIVDGIIRNYDTNGKALGKSIADVKKATYIGIDEKDGYLIVCEDGSRQQVLFYDISGSGTPTLVKTFGDLGGIGSGVPGEYKPNKLFALKGAGTDKEGNIYVTLSCAESVIRKFTPDGTLVWEEASFHFIDSVDFLPGTDGEMVYGVDEIYAMDYSKSNGQEATIKALTRDLIKYPGERESTERTGSNVWVREADGKVLLFVSSMFANNSSGQSGFDIYAFESKNAKMAHYVGAFNGPTGNWAYDVDDNASIWVANDNRKIIRYDFAGFDKNGCPIYDKAHSESFDMPEEFRTITRIFYEEEHDRLFLFGYTERYPETSWGLAGKMVRVYEWKGGKAIPMYSAEMPLENDGAGTLLDPKAVDVCGDYIFACTARQSKIHIYEAATGNYVGTMRSEPQLGTSGWVDIPYGIRVTKRSNGEYVVAAEEDWRAKNIIYRWNPDAPAEVPEEDATENTDNEATEGTDNEETEGTTDAITLEKEKDIRYVNGYPDGTFKPEAGITRAEVASIFYRLIAAEDKGEKKTVSFSDVSESDWYYEAVAYLENHGLISGYPDGTFGPGNSITRAEFVTIASRFDALSEGKDGQYSDVTADHWASKAILSAAAKGWVGGFPDGTFHPNDNVTRAQVVAVVNRMLGKKAASASKEANQFTDLSEDHWAYGDILEATTGE